MPFRKNLFSLLWVIAATLKAYAQTPDEKASALPPTVEALRTEIEAVKPGEMPLETYEALCDRVYQNGSAALIALCIEKPELMRNMWVRVAPETDSALQKRNVLIVLRAGRRMWGDQDDPFRDGGNVIQGGRWSYCDVILKRYLPAETLKRYPLSEKENQLSIASLFEKTIGDKTATNQTPSGTNPPGIPSNQAIPEANPPSPMVKPLPSRPESPDEIPVAKIPGQSPVWPWFAGITALAAIALLVWKRNHS